MPFCVYDASHWPSPAQGGDATPSGFSAIFFLVYPSNVTNFSIAYRPSFLRPTENSNTLTPLIFDLNVITGVMSSGKCVPWHIAACNMRASTFLGSFFFVVVFLGRGHKGDPFSLFSENSRTHIFWFILGRWLRCAHQKSEIRKKWQPTPFEEIACLIFQVNPRGAGGLFRAPLVFKLYLTNALT